MTCTGNAKRIKSMIKEGKRRREKERTSQVGQGEEEEIGGNKRKKRSQTYKT